MARKIVRCWTTTLDRIKAATLDSGMTMTRQLDVMARVALRLDDDTFEQVCNHPPYEGDKAAQGRDVYPSTNDTLVAFRDRFPRRAVPPDPELLHLIVDCYEQADPDLRATCTRESMEDAPALTTTAT